MRIVDVVQGSEEWFAVKCGVPSASDFEKIVTVKGEQSKQREKYLYQLAGERITGKSEETYTNGNMQRGKELEDEARKLYEFNSKHKTIQVGFCLNEKPKYGCSPDGLIGKDGLLEIKCPILTTQVNYLINKTFPLDYFQQTQGQLLVTGRKWLDFISYCPGMKPLIIRVKRNNEFLVKLEAELKLFCLDLDKIVKKIK